MYEDVAEHLNLSFDDVRRALWWQTDTYDVVAAFASQLLCSRPRRPTIASAGRVTVVPTIPREGVLYVCVAHICDHREGTDHLLLACPFHTDARCMDTVLAESVQHLDACPTNRVVVYRGTSDACYDCCHVLVAALLMVYRSCHPPQQGLVPRVEVVTSAVARLPADVAFSVMSLLDDDDRRAARVVCAGWYRAVSDPLLPPAADVDVTRLATALQRAISMCPDFDPKPRALLKALAWTRLWLGMIRR